MLTAKNMIDMYVKHNLSHDTWSMFLSMAGHELIAWEDWEEFFETCQAWEINASGRYVIDRKTNAVVYVKNADGNWEEPD